ncbi:DUF2158 domain-containing protein [Methylorubrum extorquens]
MGYAVGKLRQKVMNGSVVAMEQHPPLGSSSRARWPYIDVTAAVCRKLRHDYPKEFVMPNKFEKGDVVVLKSGGPPMTVDDVPGTSTYSGVTTEYFCKWFKGATADSGYYGEHLLEKYTPPAKK